MLRRRVQVGWRPARRGSAARVRHAPDALSRSAMVMSFPEERETDSLDAWRTPNAVIRPAPTAVDIREVSTGGA